MSSQLESPTPGKMPTRPQLFDERHWEVLKMRVISVFVSFSFPAWSPVYRYIYQNAYDPLWMRVAMTIPCWLVIYLSYTKKSHARYLDAAFNVMGYSLTYFMFFLIYRNDLSLGYILAGYCMFFVTGAVLNSFRSVAFYYASCLAISLYYSSWQENSVFLFGGILCAAAVSAISQNSIHKLLTHLRESRLEVETVNASQDNMLNALGEGYFSFDATGICKRVFSTACLELIEASPAGRNIFDVLKMPAAELETNRELLEIAFQQKDRFDFFVGLMPKTFEHSAGKVIALKFRPVFAKTGHLAEILVIASDETELVKAKRDAEIERRELSMIATIVKDRRFFALFLKSCLRDLAHYLSQSESEIVEADFRRFLHSAKGASALFGMVDINAMIHQMENIWREPALSAGSSGRLAKDQAHHLDKAIRHFLTSHAGVFGEEFQSARRIEIRVPELLDVLQKSISAQVPIQIQQLMAGLALVPVEKYFSGFTQLTQRLATTQRKKLNPVAIENGEVMIFPEKYETLLSCFVHLFTNAVDHGLESPEERLKIGKPEFGQISVSFKIETLDGKSSLVVQVSDDGRGVDPRAIRAKLGSAAPDLADAELIQKIFDPHFSTRTTVTATSGRGLGLSALREATIALGGSIRVQSVVGQSTTILVRVPYLAPVEAVDSFALRAS